MENWRVNLKTKRRGERNWRWQWRTESVRRGRERSAVDLVKRYAVIFDLPEGSSGGGGVFGHQRTEANGDADLLHFAAFLTDSVLQCKSGLRPFSLSFTTFEFLCIDGNTLVNRGPTVEFNFWTFAQVGQPGASLSCLSAFKTCHKMKNEKINNK